MLQQKMILNDHSLKYQQYYILLGNNYYILNDNINNIIDYFIFTVLKSYKIHENYLTHVWLAYFGSSLKRFMERIYLQSKTVWKELTLTQMHSCSFSVIPAVDNLYSEKVLVTLRLAASTACLLFVCLYLNFLEKKTWKA